MPALRSLFFVLVIIISATSHAELSPTQRLRKISLSLRGSMPSQTEYQELLGITVAQQNDFFKIKTKEYMKAPAYAEKMSQRLETLYRLRIEDRTELNSTSDSNSAYSNEIPQNSLNSIFKSIFNNNETWDQLLLNKTYAFNRKYYSYSDSDTTDLLFFEGAFPGLQDNSEEKEIVITAQTENEKLITAGSLTTARFFDRYATTKINKNRRRAAAIFRIFLCDEMRPVVLPSANENLDLLALAFNEQGGHLNPITADQEARHGSDPSCQACHYKLDPAGKTYGTSTVSLNPVAAPGALVYRRRDGSLVNIPVRGIGELANAITAQPEYATCQVHHFWNWFIGKDIELSSKRENELVNKFNSLNRKPNDFIDYLLSQPEFSNEPTPETSIITVASVRPIFRECNQCHSYEGTIPEFDTLPIGGDQQTHIKTLGEIVKKLDLTHDGLDATMPPKKKTNWRLTKNQTLLIKRWISEGAKNDEAQPTIGVDDVKLLSLDPNADWKVKLEPTFENTYYKYLQNHDYFRIMLPLLGSYSVEQKCLELSNESRDLLGVSSAVDGKPIFQTPSPGTVRYLINCINLQLQQFDKNPNSGSFKFYSQALMNELKIDELNYKILNWIKLTPNQQLKQIEYIVIQLLGPNYNATSPTAIKAKLIFDTLNKYTKNNNTLTVKKASYWTLQIVATSEEFLSY